MIDQIAFPANMQGSGFYRIALPQNVLTRQNPELNLQSHQNLVPLHVAQSAKSVLFQWVYSDVMLNYMKEIRKHTNASIIYEIDDLFTKIPHANLTRGAMPKDLVARVKEAMAISDRVVTTTDYLAEAFSHHTQTPIYVAPNAIPNELVQPIKHRDTDKKMRVGWHGSVSHSGDLALIKDLVRETIDEFEWVFFGMFPAGLEEFVRSGKIEFHEGKPIEEFLKTLTNLNLHVGLAPLENHPFNDGKSDLKILEYGAMGIPVIASDMTPYKPWPVTKLKNRYKDWLKALRDYADDEDNRSEDAKTLQMEVRVRGVIYHNSHKFSDAWGIEVPNNELLLPPSLGRETVVNEKPSDPEVTVIVPIYAKTAEPIKCTRRCLSALASAKNETPFNVECIIDGDPIRNFWPQDEEAKNELHELASDIKKFGFSLHKQEINIGFTKTINKAAKRIKTDSFVILNSDTVVTDGWLDGMMLCANDETIKNKIASITPLTNNGELASYPSVFRQDNPTIHSGWLPKEIHAIEMPIGVGFCMLIKSDVWRKVGGFDEDLFPVGYGEETEWCLRAGKEGYKHYLSANSYVWHEGAVSFGNEKRTRLATKGIDIVTDLYPDYQAMLMELPKRLASFHRVTDMVYFKDKAKFLIIGHNLGGGSERWLKETKEQIEAGLGEGAAIIMRPLEKDLIQLEGIRNAGIYDLSSEDSRKHFGEALKYLGVNAIMVSQLVGYSTAVHAFLHGTDIPYSVMLHDYFSSCQRVNFMRNGEYCGAPTDVVECQRCCIDSNTDARLWRQVWDITLKKAKEVIASTQGVVDAIHKYYKDIEIKILPLEQCEWPEKEAFPEEGRVLVMGAIGQPKGADVVIDAIRYANETGSHLKFAILGTLVGIEKVIDLPNVEYYGLYNDEDVPGLIKKIKPSCMFFSSIWPETWSYVLTHAFNNAICPVAFDIGAPAERIKELGFGEVIPFKYRNSPFDILEYLC